MKTFHTATAALLLVASSFSFTETQAALSSSTSSEDQASDELFLRNIAVNSGAMSPMCECNNNNQCSNDQYCHKGKCTKTDSWGNCIAWSSTCNQGSGKYSYGQCALKYPICECNKDSQCGKNEYCSKSKSDPCTANGYSGQCKPKTKTGGRACNYKQCSNKSSGNCECKSGDICVKGNQRGANSCITSGNLNGCCAAPQDDEELEFMNVGYLRAYRK